MTAIPGCQRKQRAKKRRSVRTELLAVCVHLCARYALSFGVVEVCRAWAYARIMEGVGWSRWMSLADAAKDAPRSPGVYAARIFGHPDVVYVGMAGERSRNGKVTPKGLLARLKGYESGRVLTNGLGRAVTTRALQDPAFRQQLADTDVEDVFEFGRLAFAYVGVEVRWVATSDKAAAAELEDELLRTYTELWNRRPARASNIVVVASAGSDETGGES